MLFATLPPWRTLLEMVAFFVEFYHSKQVLNSLVKYFFFPERSGVVALKKGTSRQQTTCDLARLLLFLIWHCTIYLLKLTELKVYFASQITWSSTRAKQEPGRNEFPAAGVSSIDGPTHQQPVEY